jgi:hypothetical protein
MNRKLLVRAVMGADNTQPIVLEGKLTIFKENAERIGLRYGYPSRAVGTTTTSSQRRFQTWAFTR